MLWSPPVLRDELGTFKARMNPEPTALVFATNTGRQYDRTKIKPTMLTPAIRRANATLLAKGLEPLPEDLTPHSLRRTFASILFAVGENPPYVMAQLGHVDPKVTLGIYAKSDGSQGRRGRPSKGARGRRV